MTDIISTLNGLTPPTRDPGHNKIDHTLAQLKLMTTIKKPEYLTFRYGIDTDHRDIVIDLDSGLLLHMTE